MPQGRGEVDAWTTLFEDGDANDWQFGRGWSVESEGGNHILSGTGRNTTALLTPGYDWSDYRLKVRVKLLDNAAHYGETQVSFRRSDSGRYVVAFWSGGLVLGKERLGSGHELASDSIQHAFNTGYDLEIEGVGGSGLRERRPAARRRPAVADLTSLERLATNPTGRPFGYVRGDGINAVVYAIGSPYPDVGHIYELWLGNGWQAADLSSVGAGRGYEPVGTVRADGISAVVCRSGAPYHIQEVRLERDGWQWADLTVLAGVPTASISGGWPWAYNRRAVTRVHLPLIVR
jgi:hypothetical protein